MPVSNPIVQLSDLSYAYGERKALDDLSLDIQSGEIFGFLGPNGSGKTTLFRILSTLIPAPAGAVRMLGLDAADHFPEIRRHIGVVFQSPSLDVQLTAMENLRCHGKLYGLGGRDLAERCQRMLTKVGLIDRANERVQKFSGGMRRRVELAKGLLNQPRILLLDEPSTGLDPGARIDLWQMLKDVQADGVTVLLTTHLMDEADRCARLAILAQGKMIACDTPAVLKDQIGGDVVTIDPTDIDALDRLLRDTFNVTPERVAGRLRFERPAGHAFVPRVIEAAPGLVQSISVGKPTLEDVFIRLTGKTLMAEEAAEHEGHMSPTARDRNRHSAL